MRVDLNAFMVFATVVDAGGFTAAADRLGVSKSAVSKQVGALEDRLGTRLLNRTTRKLSLTEAGLAVFEHASRIVAEAEEVECVVGDLASAPRGTLRLNAPQSFGVLHLGPVLAAFHARYPEITIDVTLSDRQVDLVEEGFDAAIRIAKLKDSTLIARKLMTIEQHLYAAPAHVETHGLPRSLCDLADHRFIAYALQERPNEVRFVGEDGRSESVRVDPILTTTSGDLQLRLVEEGVGLAVLPDFIASDALERGSVVRLCDGERLEPRDMHVVYPAVRHLAAKVRVFVDFVAAWFAHGVPAPAAE